VEMIMAGASLVGIGSGVRYRGMGIFNQVNQELAAWLSAHDTTLEGIRGAAHGKDVIQKKGGNR